MERENSINKHLFHSWSFNRTNYQIFGIGLVIIVFGYIVMATGETESYQSTKIAPLILTLGYCGVIPLSILYKRK